MNSRLDTVTDWEALARENHHKAAGLARATGVSLRQLERFFAKRRDCSPYVWLVQTRLTHAIELLRQGRANKDVAQTVGFHSVSSLYRFFREHTGFAPSEFLREAVPVDDVLRMSGWPVDRTTLGRNFTGI